MVDVNEILRKHGAMIEQQIGTTDVSAGNYSKSYTQFREEMAPEFSKYERWAHSLGNFIRLRAAKKDEEKVTRAIEIAHLDVEPWQAISLGAMAFLGTFLLGLFISVAVMLISNQPGLIAGFPFMFFIFSVVIALFLFYFINGIPERLANKWRLKASSQMVPAILYIVVYMRHTPNLEKAIAFASEHLDYPLALDFKKVFYNVQVGKFSTMKESLDNYLETWRDYSPAFIESFHLIESSLFEPDDSRRIATLEKSLQVVLDGVYDQMLKFVHNVKSPIQNTYMLGTTLPVLGIAMLPLASAMLGGMFKSIHVFILYNVLIPFAAFFLMNKYLMLRPGGYGETSLLEKNPYYATYKSNKPYWKAFFLCLPLFLLGALPLIFQYTPLPGLLGLQTDYTLTELGLGFLGNDYIFDFKAVSDGFVGPFGIGALFLSMFIPLGIALFFSTAYKEKTKLLIKERERTKSLEAEFNNSLFQLGNRIGNGLPPESAFGKVAESSQGLMTEDFFRRVNYNIRQMGMSVEKAVFDRQRGALIYYPSNLIGTSMRVLIESSKKGLKIAAVSLMSISEYVKNIQKISSRLKDILAEIVSDMKSNMSFLAPLLSGVVVGLAAMIVAILNKINLAEIDVGSATGVSSLGDILNIFAVVNMIPPYYLQIAIGVYLIQMIFILTGTLVSIDSGEDKLQKTNQIGQTLKSGITMYIVTAIIATGLLFILVAFVLPS